LLVTLTKQSLLNRYAGSALGLVWTIIQPLLFMTAFWLIFAFGLKGVALTGHQVPFVASFFCGFASWMIFQEATVGGVSSITGSSFLVKKIAFPVEVIPLVPIMTGIIAHTSVLVLFFITMYVYDLSISLMAIQAVYYLVCMCLFCAGLNWLLSSMAVFLKDIPHLVQSVISVALWISPVFWDPNALQGKFRLLVFVNPASYPVIGYKYAFLYQSPFWEHPWHALYFWTVTIALLVLGSGIFTRLRPHFADVL